LSPSGRRERRLSVPPSPKVHYLIFLDFVTMAEEGGEQYGRYPLTKGELQGIPIGDDETENLRTKGSKCLVGRLGVPKKLNKEAFKSFLLRIWRTTGRVFFKEIQDNLWLFEFVIPQIS
jgi:hypothetical protein